MGWSSHRVAQYIFSTCESGVPYICCSASAPTRDFNAEWLSAGSGCTEHPPWLNPCEVKCGYNWPSCRMGLHPLPPVCTLRVRAAVVVRRVVTWLGAGIAPRLLPSGKGCACALAWFCPPCSGPLSAPCLLPSGKGRVCASGWRWPVLGPACSRVLTSRTPMLICCGLSAFGLCTLNPTPPSEFRFRQTWTGICRWYDLIRRGSRLR